MLVRLIAPDWLLKISHDAKRVIEADLTSKQIKDYNEIGYNIYYLPNSPSQLPTNGFVDGTYIDTFTCVFVDFDCKSNTYPSKEAFIEKLYEIEPTKVVDSGNGIHGYFQVSDLDAKSYLKLSRRLMRYFNTDEAVGQIFQLMRLEGTLNTKKEGDFKTCYLLTDKGPVYTCEQLDKLLPPITVADEQYCEQHYDKTYNLDRQNVKISDVMPSKFGKLLLKNKEASELWASNTNDRSKDDYRLAHIMIASDFSKDEAATVLANSSKALARAPIHRITYAQNIVDKVWTHEKTGETMHLSPTVRDILSKGEETLQGKRFACNRLIDDTVHGFRLGQVMGIIGGSGVGKTTLTLNAFLWFVEQNPDYHHFFFSLEQPVGEIASRIRTISNGNDNFYDKIHIISNYSESGEYNHMSIDDIEKHILTWERVTKKKAGAVVVDHIGVLDKSIKNGEAEGLIGICRKMKSVAVNANIMLIMLSQAPREKAGVGDIELDKSAAYGTVFFESFVDYCICLWQPLKRVYSLGAPTIMAIKFAKIRHKKQHKDRIKEDICYQFFFDPETEHLRELTDSEEVSAKYWVGNATSARKADKKTDIVTYVSRRTEEVDSAEKERPSNRNEVQSTNSNSQKH